MRFLDAKTGKDDKQKAGYLWSFEYGKATKGSPKVTPGTSGGQSAARAASANTNFAPESRMMK